MVVLRWIKKKEPWNTFVGNRVKEIIDLTNIDDWRHVNGEVNPADLATRCCDWSDLLKSKWWEGPGWLYSDEESWPCSEVSETTDEAFLEQRKTVVTNLATGNEAEETLIKFMQSEWPSEIHEKYKDTTKFFEENGILKVQTRLILNQDPEDFTHPTILPDHPLLERLVLYTHRALMHAGVLTTLAQLREKFWIPKGRRNFSPLPPDRIHRVAAFPITGADLAGPLSLRGGSKAGIVLFTWAVYRAVHMELVSSLSTESFMQALRRFWAKRGRNSTLYTDNATNFVGAANALKSLDWDFIQAECSLMKIKWLFSPPSATWYGGSSERMVRSIKELLRKCLDKACVTYEEMLTLLNDCEATINGRTLTYLSGDPKELKSLTPAHFIQDIKERETFDLYLIDSHHILKRGRYLHTLQSNLRKRFYKEYLGELDGVERVAKLRLASGEIIRPLQRIYPLELSPSDYFIEDHQGADIAAQIPGPTAADVLEEGKKYRCGRPLIPVKRLNL
ncbi:integrase catalytic domain-containing protein [Trichonephila clavipes]|nr:integrase catalytic domain-containing protein [Trichonephila clavipes]